MEERFEDSVNNFFRAIAELAEAFKSFDEALKDLPDYTIQENLSSECVLNHSLNS
jgi:hypothetical protein